jgi:hypothetical protein
MVEWSKDHVVAICSLNLNHEIFCRFWLNWALGGALKWKAEKPSGQFLGLIVMSH